MQRIGHYEVVRPLGQGAAGEVFEVRAPEGGAPLALKLLTAQLPEIVARFAREGALLQFLSRHPRIVRIRDLGDERGKPWIVMDLVRGGTLSQRMSGGASVRELIPILVDVARALHFAHEAGVVHRDVKPSNVLIDDDGRGVLSDFGIARDMRSEGMTKTGTVMGTPQYMAPEQIEASKTVDRRADVYALGAILYKALTGVVPFEGTSAEVYTRILLEEPRRPSLLVPDLDPRLEALSLSALSKDPARRPQTAEDFARSLEEALVPVKPTTRTRPIWIGPSAVAAVVMAVAGFAAGSLRRRDGPTEGVQGVTERPAQKAPAPSEQSETLAAAHPPAGKELETVREWLRAARIARDEGGASRAAPLIEKAFELDPIATAHEGGSSAAGVLHDAALEALKGQPDPSAVSVARRRTLRARLLDPKLPLRDVAEIVWRLGSSRDLAMRHAARPWRLASDHAGLEAALRDTNPLGVASRDQRTWPGDWRTYMAELNFAHSMESYEATLEWLVWQPGLTFIWSYSGTFARAAGRPREAERVFEAALDGIEVTDAGISELEFQWGETLLRWGEPEKAIPHLERTLKHDEIAWPGTVSTWHELSLAFALTETGGGRRALDELAKIKEPPDERPHAYPLWAKILALESLGRKTDKALLDELRARLRPD
jgi:tetratricopeptide (TPR) repeat protein